MLKKEEIIELSNFIDKYKEIETSIDIMQNSIESLSIKRDNLLEELEKLQETEVKFIDTLVKKYGAAEVTPFKLLQIYQSTQNDN